MFRGTLPDAPFPHHSSLHFRHLHPVRWLQLRCSSLSTSPNPCATPQGGLLFGRLAEQSPLTGYEPKSLSSEQVSTRRSIFFFERTASTRTSAISRLQWMRLKESTTTVFSGARCQCQPTQCFWFWGTFKRGETQAGRWSGFQAQGNLCEMLSHFQVSRNHRRKVNEIENWRVCNFSQLEKEKILSEPRSNHEYLDKKADRAFQGEFAAQTRLSEAQAELDRREWEWRNADIALYETSRKLEFQKMELHQANQLSDQAHREKSWLCEELDLRNSFSGRSNFLHFLTHLFFFLQHLS